MQYFVGHVQFFYQKGIERTKACLSTDLFTTGSRLAVCLAPTLKSKLAYHREAVQSADILKTSVENPASRIDVMTNCTLQAQIAQNKHILRAIVWATIFFGLSRVCHFKVTML